METEILLNEYPTLTIQECQDMVNGYMVREKGTEDVDYIQEKGGVEWLTNGLKTSLETGINSNSLAIRDEKYGNNRKEVEKLRSWFYFAWVAFEDFLLRILLAAGIILLIIELSIVEKEDLKLAWIEGFAILFAVALIVVVTASNNLSQDREFKRLNDVAESGKVITILRNGQLMIDVTFEETMVGDVIILKSGMEAPADCILLEGFSVEMDESSATGESKGMKKIPPAECVAKRDSLLSKNIKLKHHDCPSSIILAGTKVLNGNGKVIAINVGRNSAIGKINELVAASEGDDATPLQLKLEKLARDISIVGLTAAVILFIATLIKWIVKNSKSKDKVTGLNLWKSKKAGIHIRKFFKILLTSVTILVVAIPEGLPLAVTLSLAFAVAKMMKENNLVRKMDACETMGGATVICSDKTGTLTKNEMYFTDFYNEKDVSVYEATKARSIPFSDLFGKDCLTIFLNTIIYNSLEDPTQKRGNPTEMALLKYLMMCDVDVLAIRNDPSVKKIFQATFTSDRKRMSTIVRLQNGRTFAFLKGASEYVLETSNYFHDLVKNTVVPLTTLKKKECEMAIEGMAKRALRTIGLAYKEITDENGNYENTDERGLYDYERNEFILIGVCGIKDVIRPEVPESIRKCRVAGIDVKMVTGDNKITAYAIAQEVGIIGPHNENKAIVLEGSEFLRQIGGIVCGNCLDKPSCTCVSKESDLDKEENKGKLVKKDVIKNTEVFNSIWPNLCVLARSRPEDKYALVTGIKNLEQVVAVTGDGTNDAPALSKASVGFAMNIAGTEVAKKAADILLMDDNFASIVVAVKWGRHIYSSVQKFLQLQMTVSIVAVVMTFISSLGLDEAIFSAVQMLWINLIMDTLAALALATEPPSEEILKKKPIGKLDYMITVTMMKHIIGQSIFQIVVLCVFIFAGPKFLFDHTSRRGQRQPNSILIVNGFEINGYDQEDLGYSVHAAYNFNCLIFLTIFNFFNCRVLDDSWNCFKDIWKSTFFLLIVGIIIVLQIIFLTFAGPAIRIAFWGLHPSGWALCIGFGFAGLVFGFLLRLIPTTQFNNGFGNKELPKEELNKRNSLSIIRRSHNQNFFRGESLVRRPSHRESQRLSQKIHAPDLPSVKEVIIESDKMN